MAEPENVQADHLERDESWDDFTRVRLVNVDGRKYRYACLDAEKSEERNSVDRLKVFDRAV